MSAEDYADDIFDLWQCPEQIEAHMESEGFTGREIDEQLRRLGFNRAYQMVHE